jgi:hypothetical protein
LKAWEGFDRSVNVGVRTTHGCHARSLDVRGRAARPESWDAHGAVSLRCTFDGGVEEWLRGRRALIFLKLNGVPFGPYRGQLYSPREL